MHKLKTQPELYARIISQIKYEQQLLKLRTKLILFGLMLATSLVVFVVAFKNLFVQANLSGFLLLLHLSATDFKIISTHLFDYVLSLAESLPVVSVALVGAVLLFTLFSSAKLINYLLKIKHLRIN